MLAAGDQAVAANETVGFAFSILDAVKTPGYTQWQIVYDLASREIHFRTAKNHQLKRIRLTAFNFSCTEPVLGFPINSEGGGDVSDNFSQLTDYQNAQMVAQGVYPILSSIPEGITKKFEEYPASTYCENSLVQRTDPANNSL
jgi:hypothetical protein